MKARDNMGRFAKQNEWYTINLVVPSFKKLIYWVLLIILLFPWIIIGGKFNIFQKIFQFFENIMEQKKDEQETPKKNRIFFK